MSEYDDTPRVPHDPDVERTLLAGALLGDRTRGFLLDEAGVQPHEFYAHAHRVAWAAITTVDRAGDPVDAATVVDAARADSALLERTGIDIEDVRHAVHAALSTATDTLRLERHAAILRDLAERRRILDACWATVGDVHRQDIPAETIRAAAEQRFAASDTTAERRDTVSMPQAIDAAIPEWETPARFRGLSTGFPDADELLKGLRPGQLIIVGARPAMGKSAFALDLVRAVALEQNRRVLLISLEMDQREIAARFVAAQAGIPGDTITLGRLADYAPVFAVGDLPQTRNIVLTDRNDLSADDVASIARHEARKHAGGLGLVVVDYLQLLRPSGRTDNRNQQVSEMSRALKVLAGTLGCPVVALSQLKRTEARRPRLDDLRDSGSLEQDANAVLFLHREDYYDREAAPGIADLIVAKNRGGAIGDVQLLLQATYPRFVSAPGPTGRGPIPLPNRNAA